MALRADTGAFIGSPQQLPSLSGGAGGYVIPLDENPPGGWRGGRTATVTGTAVEDPVGRCRAGDAFVARLAPSEPLRGLYRATGGR